MRPEFYVVALWLARETADPTRVAYWANKMDFRAGGLAAMAKTYAALDRGHRILDNMAQDVHTIPMYDMCKGVSQTGLKNMARKLQGDYYENC